MVKNVTISLEQLKQLQGYIKLHIHDLRVLEKVKNMIDVHMNDSNNIEKFVLDEINLYVSNGLFADIYSVFQFENLDEIIMFMNKSYNPFIDTGCSEEIIEYMRKKCFELTACVLKQICKYQPVTNGTASNKNKKSAAKNNQNRVYFQALMFYSKFMDSVIKEAILDNKHTEFLQRSFDANAVYKFIEMKTSEFKFSFIVMEDENEFVLPFSFIKNKSGIIMKYLN